MKDIDSDSDKDKDIFTRYFEIAQKYYFNCFELKFCILQLRVKYYTSCMKPFYVMAFQDLGFFYNNPEAEAQRSSAQAAHALPVL